VVAAGLMQAGLLYWGVMRTGAKVRFGLPRLTPQVKALIALAVPGVISASATQINIFISGVLASGVAGARSWLAVADRLYQLPLGLVGVAVGVALLPRLSRAVQAGDVQEAQDATDQAIVLSLALTLPAAAALTAIPFFLIDGLFTRGAFTTLDAHQTASALFHYGWGVPAFVLARVLSPAFFARQDTKAPMRFALISVAVNIGAGLALFQLVGFQGIAAATAIAAWINVGQMVFTLARRGDYQISAGAFSRVLRVTAASVAMGLLLAAASHWRAMLEAPLSGLHVGHALGPKEIAVVLACLIGVALYPVMLVGLGGVSVADLKSALKRGGAKG
jgi:putative peptidoglycan lipid II flippase